MNPIVILCMGRSGSSLTAGIFHEHGVWVGDCLRADARNPKGYFENIEIKKALQKRSGRTIDRVYDYDPGWREFVDREIERQGYSGGPWLVKHNAIFWPVWGDYDPSWVLVRRDPEVIFRSIRKAGFCRWMNDAKLREVIQLHNDQMDYIRDTLGGVDVDTDAVVNGDHETLREAVEHCGLSFNPEIAHSFVDTEHWHQ